MSLVPSGSFSMMSSQQQSPARPEGYELVSALAYFRHGARAPIYGTSCDGVTDAWWNTCGECAALSGDVDAGQDALIKLRQHGTMGPPRPSAVDATQRRTVLPGGCRSGELTRTGYQQATLLGQRLRSMYGEALDMASDDFTDRLSARTTHVARCVLSLRGVLEGLRLDEQQPIMVDTVHISEEWLTPQQRQCARLAELWSDLLENRHKFRQSIHADVLKDIAGRLPEEVRQEYGVPWRAVPLKDALIARASLGAPLPWDLTDDDLENLDLAAAAEVAGLMGVNIPKNSKELLRLSAGRLIHELASDLQSPRAKTFRLVAGHDTTIKPLLVALDLYDHRWPPFCACVAVEVYEENASSDRYVRVLYNGATAAHVASDGGAFYVAQPLLPLRDVLARLEPNALDENAFRLACSCGLSGTAAAAGEATTGTSSGDTF